MADKDLFENKTAALEELKERLNEHCRNLDQAEAAIKVRYFILLFDVYALLKMVLILRREI